MFEYQWDERLRSVEENEGVLETALANGANGFYVREAHTVGIDGRHKVNVR